MDTLKKFEELGLSQDLLKAISGMGFETATPIQSQAIPEILDGNDVVGLASTGTGKTAAFGLPAIEKLDMDSRDVQTLILCPTRELAIQVAVELTKFLKFKRGVGVLPVYGGQDIRRQIMGLRRNPQIIIGTPGRTLDHLERGTLRINKINMLILDEADKMLDMGFRDDIERILKATKKDKQTVLFSATMSREILQMTNRYQKNPKIIKIKSEGLSKLAIEQIYLKTEPAYKIDYLMDIINKYQIKLAIVFCNTKRKVDKLAKILNQTGFRADGLHGDMRQSRRDSIMNKFRKGRIQVLIATDVAARGIDVNGIEAVFNFEVPRETEAYVHRVGRTGRAGKSGKAFSFVSRAEMNQFRKIIRYNKIEVKEFKNEPVADVENGDSDHASKKDFQERTFKRRDEKPLVQRDRTKLEIEDSRDDNSSSRLEKKAHKVLSKIKQGVSADEHSVYLDIAQSFTSKKYSSEDLSAALLKMLVESDKSKRFSSRYR